MEGRRPRVMSLAPGNNKIQGLLYEPPDQPCRKIGRLGFESQVHRIPLAAYLISPSLSFTSV